MPYKGNVSKNSTITAELSCSSSNSGSALLFITSSDGNGDSKAVAPGGADSVSITPTESGILNVIVDFGSNTDSGVLTVKENGSNIPGSTENIQGDLRWSYSVN
ncbi:hypothetical protein A8B79_09415 [Balneola sp. EhC07]|jgi:hypothetical protein|uniref:hypothetical protein n=1 Tax=Balneola sp. EhC07 TaxID=1849360 RepID=UPI0007F3AC54|nr:hypothetical protein [Balneola sp. EhC07]OAN60730.1 hypothetical protein A8B79_09415 [Balneola sp. EhC07]